MRGVLGLLHAQAAVHVPVDLLAALHLARTRLNVDRLAAHRAHVHRRGLQPSLERRRVVHTDVDECRRLARLAVDAESAAQARAVVRENLPVLYAQQTLAANTVPAAAAIFYDDMFVPFEYSVATARSIRGLRPVITNAYQHDGIRMDGEYLVETLIKELRR